ncbi:XRE family transcriptional regulator [Clostridium carboxidivorans P7]|uniref:Transcriptional regulator, XRE family n=1 Tax=Clostridium carboxidivorans P7 TaxID=536227 RepID=C6PX45_9CLOT|nr:helix-turn-helix transcriptional regulator [Clostridium carboxidivorans]AKN32732.1 XRE family transcriptional regulator [Clostridium carboxidivorans P7]EET86162.1 transcriptional regulator, XRE family [Clostridium carboxidivorans P7]EFG90030.1 helix-turn-helix domain-containing protein [Clostridium carboxidivorans P7]
MINELTCEIGKKIRNCRKSKNITMQQLADIIHKSKASVSKYEKGDIVVDIVTLYDIAAALNIHIEQLLYSQPVPNITLENKVFCSQFFSNATHFYSYYFDGRNNKIVRSAMDILSEVEPNIYKVMLYMNFKEYENYQICENTYYGFIEHHNVLTNILLKNQATAIEQITISILADFLDSPTKWGLMFGISSRPIMPIALKILFSQKPLKENNELKKLLQVSKEDIRNLKMYNMFIATPDW